VQKNYEIRVCCYLKLGSITLYAHDVHTIGMN
jgi:hypothetical protein